MERALALSTARGGKLIVKPDLAKAMHRYHYITRRVGMVGEKAPHSLRYAYAEGHLDQMEEKGVSRRDAAAAVSTYLGHGDGRGRWVVRVYGRKSLNSENERKQ